MRKSWGKQEWKGQDVGGGRKIGDETKEMRRRWVEKKRKGRGFGFSLRPGDIDPLRLLKREGGGALGIGRVSSRGGELFGLLCFRIGIKQSYFGFRDEFLASGVGWESQIQGTVEMVQRSFILSTNKASWGQMDRGASMNSSPLQLKLLPPSSGPVRPSGNFLT